jgi:hypothetical protein
MGREPFLVAAFRAETEGVEQQEFYQRVLMAMPRLFLEVVAVTAVLLVAVVFALANRAVSLLLPCWRCSPLRRCGWCRP